MRPVVLAVAGAALAALLNGCGHDSGDLDAPDSPVARYDWDGGSAMEALAQGTLVLHDGCLVMGDADGDAVHGVLVFPRSLTSWDNDKQVLTYAGHEFRMGDSFSAGGGSPGRNLGDIPEACMDQFPAADAYFLIQDESIDPAQP
ncbi:MAG: hypothetical protein NVV57_09235 [Demequina sp.]|jgi:hypothetical protein|nr:hypothetical protein [Demequina sp.]